MKVKFFLILSFLFFNFYYDVLRAQGVARFGGSKGVSTMTEIKLPKATISSNNSIEKVLFSRRSVRTYKNEPLTLNQVSQLLWSTQSITSPRGLRIAPSAGALYPLEVYLIAGNVTDLPAGIYKYDHKNHKIKKVVDGDKRQDICDACLGQSPVKDGAINILICGIYSRTTGKYGDRGKQYVHVEVGCVAQNVYLQVESLGLGTVYIGALDDKQIKQIAKLPASEIPFCVLPVGKK